MMGFIKNIFRKRFLRKVSSSNATGLLPLQDIHSAAIIIDTEEPASDECKENVQAWLKSNGIRSTFFFFDFSKGNEDERQTTSLNNTILRKDLNWFGRPAMEKLEMIAEDNSDVLISLVDNSEFPIECIGKYAPARFKIGRRQLPGRTFDLVVENPPTQSFTALEAFKEISRYLETIK